jgi:hypothetical protein
MLGRSPREPQERGFNTQKKTSTPQMVLRHFFCLPIVEQALLIWDTSAFIALLHS